MSESLATTEPKRKRRWFQYSLRTFLLLVTVFCVWLGWLTNQARQQRAAVAWVEEMGGSVAYDYEYVEEGDDAKPPGPTWLREMLGIDFLADVIGADLSYTKAIDLTPIAGLEDLERLDLFGAHVNDLTPLAGLTNLRWLVLDDTPVSDVTPVARLSNLEELYLVRVPVSDVTPLAGLKSVKILALTGTQVRDVVHLVACRHLRSLSLRGTQVTEDQVADLRKALPNCTIYWKPR